MVLYFATLRGLRKKHRRLNQCKFQRKLFCKSKNQHFDILNFLGPKHSHIFVLTKKHFQIILKLQLQITILQIARCLSCFKNI